MRLARRDFAGVPDSVAAARHFVAGVLADWEEPSTDAVLLVSELATNAVLHARSAFSVEVGRSPSGRVRIEVGDDDPAPPAPGTPIAAGSVGGRGLILVTVLARHWGYTAGASGKVVWFEV